MSTIVPIKLGLPAKAKPQRAMSLKKTPLRFGKTTLLQDNPFVIDFSVPVTGKTVNQVCDLLQQMAQAKRKLNDPGSIKLIINSPGGEMMAGYKLLGFMHQLNVPVDTIVMGIAASMASVLMLAGASKGRRFMDRYATLMIHQPSVSGIGGTTQEISEISQHLSKSRDKLDGLLSRCTGLPLEKIQEMTRKDTYISPLRALKDGFTDYVLIKGDKGLDKNAVKNLSDDQIDRRDRFNQYDDLPMITLDPMSSNPGGGKRSIKKALLPKSAGNPGSTTPPAKNVVQKESGVEKKTQDEAEAMIILPHQPLKIVAQAPNGVLNHGPNRADLKPGQHRPKLEIQV